MHRDCADNWRGVLLAVTVGTMAAVHYGKVAPALPRLLAELPISLVVGGWIVSVFSVTGAGIGIAMGVVADAVGARRTVLAGLLAISAGSLLGAASTGETQLLISRFVEGLGFIAVAVGAPVLVVRSVTAASRHKALGLWITYMPGGMALATLVVPGLLDHLGWRELWVGAAALTLVCAILVWRDLPPDPAGSRDGVLRVFARMVGPVLRNRGSWLLSLAFFFYALLWISLMAWLPNFLVEQRQMGAAGVGMLTAAVVLFNIPGNLSVTWLLSRGVQRWLLIVLGGAGMGVFGWIALSPQLADGLRLAATLAFSYCGGFVPGAVLSGAPVVAPDPSRIGGVNGMMVQGAHLGQLLGPPALAAVLSISGNWADSRWLILAGAVLVCLFALAYRGLPEPARRPGSQ